MHNNMEMKIKYVYFIYNTGTEAVTQVLLYIKDLLYLLDDALHLLNSHCNVPERAEMKGRVICKSSRKPTVEITYFCRGQCCWTK